MHISTRMKPYPSSPMLKRMSVSRQVVSPIDFVLVSINHQSSVPVESPRESSCLSPLVLWGSLTRHWWSAGTKCGVLLSLNPASSGGHPKRPQRQQKRFK